MTSPLPPTATTTSPGGGGSKVVWASAHDPGYMSQPSTSPVAAPRSEPMLPGTAQQESDGRIE